MRRLSSALTTIGSKWLTWLTAISTPSSKPASLSSPVTRIRMVHLKTPCHTARLKS